MACASNRPAREATTLVASNDEAFGSETTDLAAAGTVETAAVVAAAEAAKPAPQRAKPDRATTVGARKQPVITDPVIDRVAAALPPQRRGLFGRPLPTQRVQAARVTRPAEARQVQTRQVQAAPRNRGLFKRLTGRAKPPARAWALGPAR